MTDCLQDCSLGFVVKPIEGGYTWSLSSRLGELLAKVEDRYGPRDHEYTPIGIEFAEGPPKVWFPGNRKHALIQLSLGASRNHGIAIFELAHEVVHLLAPTGNRSVPVIEEGLATAFADEISLQIGNGIQSNSLAYQSAKAAVSTLGPVTQELVREIRVTEPCFANWTPTLLGKHGVNEELAVLLCTPFPQFEEQLKLSAPKMGP